MNVRHMRTKAKTEPEAALGTDTLTVWGFPTTLLDSQYGSITYGDWCEREAKRISSSSRKATVLRQGNMVCVALA